MKDCAHIGLYYRIIAKTNYSVGLNNKDIVEERRFLKQTRLRNSIPDPEAIVFIIVNNPLIYQVQIQYLHIWSCTGQCKDGRMHEDVPEASEVVM